MKETYHLLHGLSIFICRSRTNKWKSDVKKSKEHITAGGQPLTFQDIKHSSTSLTFSPVRKGPIGGEQYKPSLPLPRPEEQTRKRISYVRDMAEIQTVGKYLFDDEGADASIIGERCFERTLEEARKR